MATAAEKLSWACDVYSPENVFCDGERSRAEATRWAVAQYDKYTDEDRPTFESMWMGGTR